LKNTRIQEMKKLFLNKKQLLNKELCDIFGVSIETVRRDLNILEQEGFIQKYMAVPACWRTPASPPPSRPGIRD